MPRARGSASPINRRSSHIAVALAEQGAPKVKVKSKKEK
jgi:ribosomal protein L22